MIFYLMVRDNCVVKLYVHVHVVMYIIYIVHMYINL